MRKAPSVARRNFVGPAAVLLLCSLVYGFFGILPVPSAQAAGTCAGTGAGHYYVFAAYCGPMNMTAISGSWNRANMYVTGYATHHFISSEIWDYTTYNRTYMFVEVGLINAWDTKNGWGGNPCHCTAYQHFWGDVDGKGNYYFHWNANISPSTTTDSYALDSVGTSNDHWNVWLDGTLIGTSTDQVSKEGYEVASGADEYGSFNENDHATTFNMYDSIATNYSWTDPAWNFYQDYKGCKYTAGGPLPTNRPCFNGTTYSNDEWSWNKL